MRLARRACGAPPARSSRARCRPRGPCTRSPSASPAPSTGRRWWSWSPESSPSTRPTARASAAPGWGRRWRSTRSCSCPTRRCRSRRARSRRGRTACPTTTSRSARRSPSATASISIRPGMSCPRRIATCSCTEPTASGCRSPIATATAGGARMRRGSRGSSETCSAATRRPSPRARARRSSSTCRCAPALPAAARACARSPARCSSRGRGSRTSPRCRRAVRCSGWTRSSCPRPTGTSRG